MSADMGRAAGTLEAAKASADVKGCQPLSTFAGHAVGRFAKHALSSNLELQTKAA